jgi:hypothetical protein
MPERVGLLDDDGSRFLREYLVAGNPPFSKVRSTLFRDCVKWMY